MALSMSHMETTNSKFLMLVPHTCTLEGCLGLSLRILEWNDIESPTWWSKTWTKVTMTKTDTA